MNSKRWATSYEGKAFDNNFIIREEIDHEMPTGMQGFAFNIRRDIFINPMVRQALTYAFDFEWTNKNLFYGQYKRSKSYFTNSELASSGLPSKEELELLNPLKNDLPKEIFNTPYLLPKTDGSGNIRKQLKIANALLEKAGWKINAGKRIHYKSRAALKFEILLISPSFERVVIPFTKNLNRLGIEANVRVVDTAQYINRLRSFDFDMIIMSIGKSLSPGNEQKN